MNERKVLISGGGIAGSTLAYWLARRGFAPTVVERADGLRSSGNPVDVRGPAVDVVERMGVLPQLREAATRVRRLTFVDADGRRVGQLGMDAVQEGDGLELPRADLASILHRAGQDDVEYRFGDSVATLSQDGDGVEVTFERAAPRRFDLVVAADGLHSRVRELVFGPERDHIRYLGMYVATLKLDHPADDAHEVLHHNTPGKAVSLHPGSGRALAAFMFRRPEAAEFDPRDTGQHRRMLVEAFEGGTWRTPQLLERALAADDLYFDAISRISLPRWSSGRVVLLGDATSCVSLFGDGSTLAIEGAANLAEALAISPDDRTALTRYEAGHRKRVAAKQRGMTAASRLLVPNTGPGIQARNAVARLWPVVSAIQRTGSKARR